MNAQVDEIFTPLADALRSRSYTDADLFHLIGGFITENAQVAYAMCMHARDITQALDEQGTESNYSDVIAEVYRRTFFARDDAARYGTEEMFDQGPEILRGFAQYLVKSLEMDDQETAAMGAPLPLSGTRQ